jgi:hypothetical protein
VAGPVFASLTSNYGPHQCGLTAGGLAYCWGRNTFGEVGDGSTTDRTTPTAVSGGRSYTSIAMSSYATCAVTAAGQVYCWGWTGEGILGDGDAGTIRTVPTLVSTGGRTYSKVAVLDDFICGIETGGALSCWGRAPDGMHILPTTVATGVSLTSLTAGFYQICGVTATGAGYCWSESNGFGQEGTGDTSPHSTPTPISGGLTFAEIRAYAYNTCGRTTTNVLYCWGNGTFGPTIGDGTSGVSESVPTTVAGGIPFGSLIGGGIGYTCAAATTGQPFCWGNGTLGTAATSSSTTPVPVDWIEGTAGVPRSLIINDGDATTECPGCSVFPDPTALVRDYAGNPINGATVAWAITSGGGTLSGATSVTGAPDPSGIAHIVWTLGPSVGPNSMTATLTVGPTVIGNITFNADAEFSVGGARPASRPRPPIVTRSPSAVLRPGMIGGPPGAVRRPVVTGRPSGAMP